MKKILVAIFTAVIVGISTWASAADVALPVSIQKYNTISYYSTGVGIEERRKLPQRYPLKIVFKTDRKNLLCDADVTASIGKKTVFQGRAQNGPWMLIDLPPGVYTIKAVLNGKERSAKGVRIKAGKQRNVVLKWKTTEVNMGL